MRAPTSTSFGLPSPVARALYEGRKTRHSCGVPSSVADLSPELDFIWARERWRTFVSLDGTADDDIWHLGSLRGAGVAFEDGFGLSIWRRLSLHDLPAYSYGEREPGEAFGRLRAASVMPFWASRAYGRVLDSYEEPFSALTEETAQAEGFFSLAALIAYLTALHGGERPERVRVWRLQPHAGNLSNMLATGALVP